MQSFHLRFALAMPALVALGGLAGCSKPESEKILDVSVLTNDSGRTGSSDGAAKVGSDQDFLRTLIDRRQGLVALAQATAGRGDASAEVREQARAMDRKRKAELDTMRTMLERTYRESRQPVISRENQTSNEGVLLERGPALDRAFREAVIEHQQGDVTLMDQALPVLTDPELKALTQRLRAEQAAEIEALKRRLGRG